MPFLKAKKIIFHDVIWDDTLTSWKYDQVDLIYFKLQKNSRFLKMNDGLMYLSTEHRYIELFLNSTASGAAEMSEFSFWFVWKFHDSFHLGKFPNLDWC